MFKVSYNSGNKGAFNPFSPGGTPIPTTHQELVHEAVVVDVITNDEHVDYSSDGYNVGAILFRALKGDMFRDESQLHWALPLDSNITEYPLINEIVLIYSALNRFYYTRKINTTSKVTSHAIYGLNEEMSPSVSQVKRSENYRKHTSEKKETGQTKQKLGRYFKDLKNVYRLRHDEGDIIFEGRSGQSIRFGASWLKGTTFQSSKNDQSPNILIRVGPDPNQIPPAGEFGLIKEDVNNDLSSIYIVSDQVVPLKYASDGASNHAKSIHDLPSKLEGNQIIINTDRIVFNAKNDKVLTFARKGIHFSSAIDFTIDTDRNYESTITKDEIIEVGNDRSNTISNDDLLEVGRHQVFKIGGDQSVDISKSSNFKIGTSFKLQSGTTITLTAGSNVGIVAPTVSISAGGMIASFGNSKAVIGTENGSQQPMILGTDLANFLDQLISIFINNASLLVPATGAPGAPSAMNPAIVSALSKLKSDVVKGSQASFNSRSTFVTK